MKSGIIRMLNESEIPRKVTNVQAIIISRDPNEVMHMSHLIVASSLYLSDNDATTRSIYERNGSHPIAFIPLKDDETKERLKMASYIVSDLYGPRIVMLDSPDCNGVWIYPEPGEPQSLYRLNDIQKFNDRIKNHVAWTVDYLNTHRDKVLFKKFHQWAGQAARLYP